MLKDENRWGILKIEKQQLQLLTLHVCLNHANSFTVLDFGCILGVLNKCHLCELDMVLGSCFAILLPEVPSEGSFAQVYRVGC